jgi:hypothetical protein
VIVNNVREEKKVTAHLFNSTQAGNNVAVVFKVNSVTTIYIMQFWTLTPCAVAISCYIKMSGCQMYGLLTANSP